MDTSKIKKGNSKNTSYFFFILNSRKKKRFYKFGPQATESIRNCLRSIQIL